MADQNEKRQIARIQIRDVLAIESLDLDVGSQGLSIRGRTGTGKTSILDSLSAAFGRSARSELVRKGTERGEILVVLDDGSQISREVTHGGLSRPIVRGPGGEAVKRPAEYLNLLAPGLALNPVEFLTSKEDRQIKMLADAFPVRVDLQELRDLAGPDVDLDELLTRSGDTVGLELAIAATKLVKSRLNEKTTLSKRAESQRTALLQKIPEDFKPEDVRGISVVDLGNELGRISQHNRVVLDTEGKRTKASTMLDRANAQVANTQAQISLLMKQLEETKAQAQSLSTDIGKLDAWLQSNPRIETTSIELRLSTLEQQREALNRFDQAQELGQEVQRIAQESESLRVAKKNLEAFPAELTRRANIPIDGLTIEDDQIKINGLPVSNLSDGERLRLAIQIAAAGTGELGFVCVDGVERLSEDVRESLLGSLEERGIQFFVTEVVNEDLSIQPRHSVEQVRAHEASVTTGNEPSSSALLPDEDDVPSFESLPQPSSSRSIEDVYPEREDDLTSEVDWAAFSERAEAEDRAALDDEIPDFSAESSAKPATVEEEEIPSFDMPGEKSAAAPKPAASEAPKPVAPVEVSLDMLPDFGF